MLVNLVGPAYDTDIPSFNQQKCINWYLEPDPLVGLSPSKYGAILKQTPGIVEGFDFGDFDSGRASVVLEDIGYVILDDMLAYLDDEGKPNYIDAINTTSGPVSMIAGSQGIFMADGVNAYFYSLVDYTLHIISDVDIATLPDGATGLPNSCAYFNGYYLLTFENSQYFFYSTDPLSWNGLDFELADTASDPITAVVADHDELWFIGTKTTEVWTLSGNASKPLIRRSGVLMTKGCTAAATIVAMDNTFYWLATDAAGGYVVVRADGYTAKTVSTSAISGQISTYGGVSDAYAFSHRVGLHEFYVLTFPAANKTWVFDILTSQWHERTSIVITDPFDPDYDPYFKAHRAKAHLYVNDTHYVLDQYTGGVNYYDDDTFDELGNPLYRLRRTALLSSNQVIGVPRPASRDNKMHSYTNLVVNMEPGVGYGSGQAEDPVLMLTMSADGGHTWESLGSREIGQQGVFNQEIRWEILGQARDLVLEFSVTDPVNAILLGATIDVIKGSV